MELKACSLVDLNISAEFSSISHLTTEFYFYIYLFVSILK